jgi:hypothetical protein
VSLGFFWEIFCQLLKSFWHLVGILGQKLARPKAYFILLKPKNCPEAFVLQHLQIMIQLQAADNILSSN